MAEQDPTSSPSENDSRRSPRGHEPRSPEPGGRTPDARDPDAPPKEQPGVQSEADFLDDSYDPNAVVH